MVMSPRTCTWHANLNNDDWEPPCGGRESRNFSVWLRSDGCTCPSISTAQVPQVPNPRQLINLALPLWGETMPLRNAAVLRISPSKAGNEISPSGVFQVTVYSGSTVWLKFSFAGLVLPCWLISLTNRDALLRISILGWKPQMLGANRRAIVMRNVATIATVQLPSCFSTSIVFIDEESLFCLFWKKDTRARVYIRQTTRLII